MTLCHSGRSPLVCLFASNSVLLREQVRGDDLVTFGAEKNASLVSAILSVKYSSSALLCCPQADAASGQGQRRRWAAHGTVQDTWGGGGARWWKRAAPWCAAVGLRQSCGSCARRGDGAASR